MLCMCMFVDASRFSSRGMQQKRQAAWRLAENVGEEWGRGGGGLYHWHLCSYAYVLESVKKSI